MQPFSNNDRWRDVREDKIKEEKLYIQQGQNSRFKSSTNHTSQIYINFRRSLLLTVKQSYDGLIKDEEK